MNPVSQTHAPDLPAQRQDTLQRLDALGAKPELSPADRALLTFCFRASDHEVYYRAAACLGSWLPRDPDLEAWFIDYCQRRDLAPKGQLTLARQRSHRRVLLARCAATVAAADTWPVPLRFDDPAERPSQPADLAMWLAAIDLLRQRAELRPTITACLEQVLPALAAEPDCLRHAHVAARWIRLWVDAVQQGSTALDQVTPAARLGRLLTPSPGASLGERLTDLMAADAMIRALLDTATDPAPWLQDAGEGDAALWLRQRWIRACLDRGRPAPAELDGTTGSACLRAEREALHMAKTAASTAPLGTPASVSAEAALFSALLPSLSRRERWLVQSPGERALILFQLIDRMDAGTTLPLAATDLLGQITAAEGAETDNRAAILLRLLSQIAAWEGLPLAGLFELRRLHALADSQISLMLIPHADQGQLGVELADALADVLEQQLRVSLATRPDFDAVRHLRLALVRHPPLAVTAALQRLVSERSYLNHRGEAVAVDSWVRDWASALRHPDAAPAPWRQLAPWNAAPGDLNATLRDFARWLGIDPDHRPRRGTVAEVLRSLHRNERSLLCAGPVASLDRTVEALLEDCSRNMQSLLERGQYLQRAAMLDAEDALAALQELEGRLQQLCQELHQSLPAPDGVVLQQGLGHLREQLGQWRRGLEICQDCATGSAFELEAALPEALIPALLAAADRGHSLQPDGPLATLHAGLDALPAIPPPLQNAWRRELVQRWSIRMQAAMADNDGDEVRRLVQQSRYRPLLQHPAAGPVLDEARRFHFDRLCLGSARAQERITGNDHPGRCLRDFLLHYSAVWIGLLIGAIFMLDFGDPWKAMAEAGDITGIVITGLLGLGGTWAWLLASQYRRLHTGGGQTWQHWPGLIGRTLGFLFVCASYTLLATGGLWWLLSRTDEVVHGTMAIGHIVVWAGFALFAGTFFGLVAKDV